MKVEDIFNELTTGNNLKFEDYKDEIYNKIVPIACVPVLVESIYEVLHDKIGYIISNEELNSLSKRLEEKYNEEKSFYNKV